MTLSFPHAQPVRLLASTILCALLSLSALADPSDPDSKRMQTGEAGTYLERFHGRLTASGEPYNHRDLTAAHRTLPFGTKVRVTHPGTGATVVVRINDRGPFIKGRILDLSGEAARRLGMEEGSHRPVTLFVLDATVGSAHLPMTGSTPTSPSVDPASLPDDEPATETTRSETTRSETTREQPVTTAPVAEPLYTVQLGVFGTEDAAQTFAQAIRATWVAPMPANGGTQFHVYYGRFAERAQAEWAIKSLADRGHRGFIQHLTHAP